MCITLLKEFIKPINQLPSYEGITFGIIFRETPKVMEEVTKSQIKIEEVSKRF